jgi:hypothetical protein
MTGDEVLIMLWRGVRIEECINRATHQNFWLCQTQLGPKIVDVVTINQLKIAGLVTSSPSIEFTDAGLKHLGKPTKAEAMKVELVNGPDVRKVGRRKR